MASARVGKTGKSDPTRPFLCWLEISQADPTRIRSGPARPDTNFKLCYLKKGIKGENTPKVFTKGH